MKSKAFYDLAEYPEFDELTANYQAVRDEALNNRLWIRWISDSYNEKAECTFLTGDWKVCPLYFGQTDVSAMLPPGLDRAEADQVMASLLAHFPRTIGLLQQIPCIKFAGLSRLAPQARLAPHRHQNPDSLIYHLGIVIPPEGTCGLTVEDETRMWKRPGEAFIFDDNLDHGAWNDSDQDRIIFYANIRRHDAAA